MRSEFPTQGGESPFLCEKRLCVFGVGGEGGKLYRGIENHLAKGPF